MAGRPTSRWEVSGLSVSILKSRNSFLSSRRVKRLIQILFALVCLGFSSATNQDNESIRNDFKEFFDLYKVRGSFILYDLKKNEHIYYNKEQINKQFTPAFTFSILNSLIALETGIIKDQNHEIPWDGIWHTNQEWNQDTDLKKAFKNSTVWYYKELSRKIGSVRMKEWLDKVQYGNADTTGGIEKFWLSGKLRITPQQQSDFVKRFYLNELPFSEKNISIVKNIMIHKQEAGYTQYGKTGWGFHNKQDIGWYVGFLESKGNTYIFSTCIQCTDPENKSFAKARVEITQKILQKLKLI